MKKAEVHITIDDSLRFVLYGVQAVIGVSFPSEIIEAVFSDSEDNQVDTKQYTFYENGPLSVVGQVAEYEPETIHITVVTKEIDQAKLNELLELAKSEIYRIKNKTG